MSSTAFDKKTSSTTSSKRRAPMPSEQTSSGSQPIKNKRSLSDRIRNLFRRDPSSKARATSNDRSEPPPARNTLTAESPQLRAPTMNWAGKKKTINPPSSTINNSSATNKKADPSRPIEISSPIITYQSDNRSEIRGENFVPRTPETVRNYMRTTTDSRDQLNVDDRVRQVNLSDNNAFRPPSYTSDRSYSPSMTYSRPLNTDVEYYFYNERSPPSIATPSRDIQVPSTLQHQRRFDDSSSPLTATEYLATKPPLLPSTTSRPSPIVQGSTMTNNSLKQKSTSSSTLNNTEFRSTTSLSKDADVPKLTAPTIPFGSTSSKKTSKSKSRTNLTSNSSSTINHLIEQNPLMGNRSSASTYGSLPDAEVIYNENTTSPRPSKTSNNNYPGISAIVAHHLRPTSVRYPEHPIPTATTTTIPPKTTTGTNVQRPPRFDTSTTTLDGNDERTYWSNSDGNESTNLSRPDGYIRPMSPDRGLASPNIGIIRVGLNISAGDQSQLFPTRSERPESPTIYRSSTTIYTRDKNHQVDRGEIRTWTAERKEDQVVPPKIRPDLTEYRYSPKNHERDNHHRNPNENLDDDNEIEEERYEISYEYDRQVEEYSYETRQYQDDVHVNKRYIDEMDTGNNLTKREQIYQHATRSLAGHQQAQESVHPMTPVSYSKETVHTCTLRRIEGYDGLGISVATDAQTRSFHFIREVEVGSPGYRAGLRQNDRIVSVNNIPVENMNFSNVLILIKQGLDNDNLQISVINELDSL